MNEIYQILNNWEHKGNIKILVASQIIKPKYIDWLVYYKKYRKNKEKRPTLKKMELIQITADDFKIGFRMMWDVVNLFEKPLAELIAGNNASEKK